MTEEIPVSQKTRWSPRSLLEERNQQENRKRAEKLEEVPKACNRIQSQRSANKKRIRTWLNHPDDRVVARALARMPTFMESSSFGRFQTWSHSQLVRKRLDQEIKQARNRGVYWTPVLDRGWTQKLVHRVRDSTCGRSGRLDIQDKVEKMLEELAQWTREAPITESRCLLFFQNRHIHELVARNARLEAEDIEQLFEMMDSQRNRRVRRHKQRQYRRNAPKAPGSLLADNPHLGTPELFLCVEKSQAEPEALARLALHVSADRELRELAIDKFPDTSHPAAAQWINQLLIEGAIRGQKKLEEKLASKAPWGTIKRVLEGELADYPQPFVRQGARRNKTKLEQWAKKQNSFRKGVAPILLSELNGAARRNVLRTVGREEQTR